MMTTADLSLRMDPAYEKIARRFHQNPAEFADAFARAWFKLTHRDMGPRARYLGKLVPSEALIWQDPVPAVDHKLVDAADVAALKAKVLAIGPDHPPVGGHGLGFGQHVPRQRQARRCQRRAHPPGTAKRLGSQPAGRAGQGAGRAGRTIQKDFNAGATGGKKVSLADLIVLAGGAAIEAAAAKAGHSVTVPFTPGRTDASQAQTDVESFAVLEPVADGFRNHVRKGAEGAAAELLIDKAQLLTLSAPEMTVLVGGLRALGITAGANTGGTGPGVLTQRPGVLTNDFFVHLLDMRTRWQKTGTEGVLEGRDRTTGAPKWTATVVDLVFGSNSQLRALAEVYAAADASPKFVQDFVAAWAKVMELDRFEIV
jgi:catalase-peroxidase